MGMTWLARCAVVIAFSVSGIAWGQPPAFERRDVTFVSQGVKCAAWYYLPVGMKAGLSADNKRPLIVMAHGYSGVKEMYLDKYADKFAAAGFAVLVFDYRYLGASEGEPRQQVIWWDQIIDYRNAITWAALQPEVDAARIGVWGSSYGGGHVLRLAAFDKRVKAVVSQVPITNTWEAFYAKLPPDVIAGISAGHARARTLRMTTGEVAYTAIVSADGKRASLPQPESYQWALDAARRAPRWENRVSVESTEAFMNYDPTGTIHLIAPIPLLMVVAGEDTISPTALQKKAFERAGEPKKLVEVPGRHFDPYDGPKHMAFFAPQLAWFQQHLMAGRAQTTSLQIDCLAGRTCITATPPDPEVTRLLPPGPPPALPPPIPAPTLTPDF